MYVLLDTKDQLLHLFKAWDITEQPPKKGKKIVVSFPKGKFNFTLAEIFVHDQKSTYGKTLYKIVMLTDADLRNKVDASQAQFPAFWGFKRGKRG